MPLAVVENIAVVLKSRLDAMIDNATYSTAISEVQRPNRFANFTPVHNQIVLTQGPAERVPDLDRPGNPPANAMRQTFLIHCHILQDERGTETIDELLNAFHADVIKAVCNGSSTWHTFGGNAIDATWGSIQFIAADGGIDGLTIPLQITCRYSEDDPTELRN
jgi:hypothetical protein